MVSAPALASQTAPLKAPGPGKALSIGLGILLVGMAAFAAVMLLPSNGSIVVAVSGPGNRAIDSVQVLVDGKKLCDTSPCVANGIPAGTHFIKVQAPGYATPSAHAVKVVRGDEAVVNLQLSPAGEGTVLKVSGEGAGLKLFIDGKDMGPLPQEVKDLTPGDHTIRVDGGSRFEAYEEKVTIVADQARSIGPLALKVRRGTANIEAGANADGAKVLLVAGSEKRRDPAPALQGRYRYLQGLPNRRNEEGLRNDDDPDHVRARQGSEAVHGKSRSRRRGRPGRGDRTLDERQRCGGGCGTRARGGSAARTRADPCSYASPQWR
ncbi:MAG: PEGA domain-containing protein [Polyangiaceae bacterium]